MFEDRVRELAVPGPDPERGMRTPLLGAQQKEVSASEADVQFLLLASEVGGSLRWATSAEDELEARAKEVQFGEVKEAQQEALRTISSNILLEFRAVKGKLNTLHTEANQPGLSPTNARMYQGMYHALLAQYTNLVKRHAAATEKARGKEREALERQARLVKPGASDEEVEAMLAASPVFLQSSMGASGQQALNALAEVREKNQALRAIEDQLRELHQLFVDLSVLVDSQGTALDVVERNVAAARAFTGTATARLSVARRSAKARRRKLCFLAACVSLVGVLVVVLPVSHFAFGLF